ncbi:hypothetical protein ED733_000528 [Metarhizium rileyi]|uniref:Uncharacterized protein n=1 Tax=Metarhizium rileyi (strain RCEF 4871) TaxID=1649241 RepID=A0A5C6FZX1_METRR|nr:hypothetical protein ED733_000528 [Metarhizium rileyi]
MAKALYSATLMVIIAGQVWLNISGISSTLSHVHLELFSTDGRRQHRLDLSLASSRLTASIYRSMAQEIAEFASLEDLDRLFCSFWPRFTDRTKTALLRELRPYLGRCATLLPVLEPRLFRTKAAKKQAHSRSLKPVAPSRTLEPSALERSGEFPPTCPTPPSTQLTTQPILPAQSLFTTKAPPPSLQPKYLPGLPDNVARTLLYTSASGFFQRNGKRCVELYQALVHGEETQWLNAIEQRLRYLGLYFLKDTLVRHGRGNVFYYTANSAKRKIAEVAALHNPSIPREEINTAIDRYLTRGKMYWDLMQEYSISAIVGLRPDYLNFYERRTTKAHYQTFLLDLKREGAKTTAELHQLPEAARTLEIIARRNLDWICAVYQAWFDGPKRKHSCDGDETISGSGGYNGVANTVLDRQPLFRETAVETAPQSRQSTIVPQIGSLDLLADTALLRVQKETSAIQSYETDTGLFQKPVVAMPGPFTSSFSFSGNFPHHQPVSNSTAASCGDGMQLRSEDATIITINRNINTDAIDSHPASFTGADFGLASGNIGSNSFDVDPTSFTGADFGLTTGSSSRQGFCESNSVELFVNGTYSDAVAVTPSFHHQEATFLTQHKTLGESLELMGS